MDRCPAPRPPRIPIAGCRPVPVRSNRDPRGCLFEIFRERWDGAFSAVQWNACVSEAGVLRGVHVHADYDEFYTLPKGRVFLALKDIRRDSPSFMASVGLEWRAADGFAVPVPHGVAHAVYFFEPSVLAFGLSGYWRAEYDIVGCRFDDPRFGIDWPEPGPLLSRRDEEVGDFATMVAAYEALRAEIRAA